MIGVIIRDLARDEYGVWTAQIICNGETIPVSRPGAWGTIPDGEGRYCHLRKELAFDLQAKVHGLEKAERREAERREAEKERAV